MNKSSFMIAGFPTREIIVEPHLKIPFIHLLKKNTKILYFILSLFSKLKVGQFKKKFENRNDRKAYLKNRFEYCNKNLFYRDFHLLTDLYIYLAICVPKDLGRKALTYSSLVMYSFVSWIGGRLLLCVY